MGNIYITELVSILQNAGLTVLENDDTDGWQSRSRSSGGFPQMPLGIQWHHTASTASPESDVNYQVNGQDSPIGNLLLDRQGNYWPIAAGAANTAGKGGPLTLSRGTVAKDNANATTFAIEAANNGIGESWPEIQIDAYFAGSNALNAYFGNRPDDIFTHAIGTGDGWTDRKIDPATAWAVQGLWQPNSCNSSGTWVQQDIRDECLRRANQFPAPIPPIPDDEEPMIIYAFDDYTNTFAANGVALSPEAFNALVAQGAVVVTQKYHGQNIKSLLHMSGLNDSDLDPK